MKYYYNDKEKGTSIEVEPERWQWGVIYNDGNELLQFGNDGIFHRVGEIEQDKLAMVVMFKNNDCTKRIDIPWRPGMKLIHKYINIHAEYFEDINKTVRIYCFGYKYEGSYSFIYILPDDRIIMSPVEDIDLTKFNL